MKTTGISKIVQALLAAYALLLLVAVASAQQLRGARYLADIETTIAKGDVSRTASIGNDNAGASATVGAEGPSQPAVTTRR